MKHLKITLGGRFLYRYLPYRRRVVMANIQQVFGESITKKEKKNLAQAFYSHLATSIKETIQLRFLSEKTLRERVEVRGHQHLLNVAAENRGVLVLTGHFGSWEFAPLGGILNFKQFQGHFHFIRKTLGNKTLEKILFRRYFQAGLHVIAKQDALHRVKDAMDNNHAVVFVLDQHASLANRDGVAVEFFGKKAGTYRSLASLSRHTGVPVVPAAGYRLPNGNHVLEFFEPIPWIEYETTQESIYKNTLAYNQTLERIILMHPEQWMWLHKRWKI
ncbi:MAG: lysophospholipid acyltransferase family protein [Legionellaceae bacterium]|nr:lysophospholipid acyltransferase family protein [Legionellaceae bacterium]